MIDNPNVVTAILSNLFNAFPLTSTPRLHQTTNHIEHKSVTHRTITGNSAIQMASPILRRFSCVFLVIPLFSLTGCNRPETGETGKPETSQTEGSDSASEMLTAIQLGDWETAKKLSTQVLIAHPDDADLITQVALVLAKTGKEREASQLLVKAAKVDGFRPASRVDDAVQGLINVGEIYAAIELLEESLQSFPSEHKHRRMLVGFLTEVQRNEKLPQHLQVLFKNRQFDLPLLFATTDTSTRRMSVKTIDEIFERNPSDHRVKLANAFLLLYRRDVNGSKAILESILDHHPDFAPAHSMYGRILSAQSRWSELVAWQEKATSDCEQYSDYWLTLGDAAIADGNLEAAIRGYWEASQRSPSNSLSWERLASAIQRFQDQDPKHQDSITKEQLQTIIAYSNQLQSLREKFNHFAAGNRTSQTEAMEISEELAKLGRLWTAEAWWAIASILPEDKVQDSDPLQKRIVNELRLDASWYSKRIDAIAMNFSEFPLPKIENAADSQEQNLAIPFNQSTESLKMADRSEAWGLKNKGEGNSPDQASLGKLIRSTGAGGGSLDFDLDGLPDLLIMNAAGKMLKEDSKPNDLLRNIRTRFSDVSEMTGVAHTGFGQGVSVGDYNEDGFPDLFFANLGSNRLLKNNGDGTFDDCSDRLVGDNRLAWSSSASFSDIDNDGISDLFVANYCKPVSSLDQPCETDQGTPEPCHPLQFPADLDVVFKGIADGRLSNATDQWIGSPLPGRGLGIVSGMLSEDRFGIFIANDMSRNAFYSNSTQESSNLLAETAGVRGVAVDGMSHFQASMGIASSDFDRDGDIDFYVTGFGREYNVYYEQVSPGLWKDESGRLGLVEPTLDLIGFGTQPIDIESDGIEEIIVTNGHIGEFDDPDAPQYDLPMQIFRRTADGRFELFDDDHWGDYFRLPHVGRALWTSDVNLDGRNDVFVTHMEEQIRLLMNESTDRNHRISFKLVSTKASRDSVGAVIRFKVNDQPRTLWMLSGDGYLCANEKTLVAGLAEEEVVTDVSVTWRDGSIDRYGKMQADACYLLIQGENEAFPLHRYSSNLIENNR